MATKLPAVLLADLSIALASEISIAGTTATLSSNIDRDNVAIPDGLIYLTLDSSNSSKEHIQAIKTGTALTSIFSVSRQGVLTSGVLRKHRIGAGVALTDFATIKFLTDLLKGTTNLDSTTPLTYDGTATISNSNSLATKTYVDGVAVAGAPNASTTVKGIVELATQAEVDAKTATGGTGALLVVTPDTQRSTLVSDGVNEIGVVATLTIATPCVITFTAHGLVANDTIQLTTTGALPTGLTINTLYYVITAGLTANTFQISATLGGSAINTSGTQSGVHSLFRSNVYVFNTTPVTTSLSAFKSFSFKAINANTTTTPTVVVNGLTITNIRKLGATALLAVGDISANMNVQIQHDGTNFQMFNTSSASFALAGNVSYIAGEAITIGQPLHYTTYSQVGNEIKRDTEATSYIASGATLTFNVTVASNSNRVLIVDIHDFNAAGSVTYNGVAMSSVQSQLDNSGTGGYLRQYSLVAPATGTNSLVVTNAASGNNCVAIATSYYNVDQTTPVEASAKAAAALNVTGGTSNITTITSNAMLHAGTSAGGGIGSNTGPGLTFVVAGQNLTSNMTNIQFPIAKANSVLIQTAQTVTTSYGWGITGSNLGVAVCQVALKPVTASSNGVVKASAAVSNALQEAKQNYVGNATQTVAVGSSVNIQPFGVDNNQSGLTIGRYYYLQDTAGTIGLSAGTVSKIILKSISATAGVIIP